ncbi:MAG: hypothetical protein JSW27_02845, partial [Phycisphaerales bacterium]
MKKKALITSILLSLTTLALIGYFVIGCSLLKDEAVHQRRDETPGNAEELAEYEGPRLVGLSPADSSRKARVPKEDKSSVVRRRFLREKDVKAVDSLVAGDTHDVVVTRIDPNPAAKPIPPAYVGTPPSRRPGEKGGRELQERHNRVAVGPATGSPVDANGDTYAFDGENNDTVAFLDGVVQYDWSRTVRPDSSVDGRSVNGSTMGGMGGYGGGGAPGQPRARGGYGGGTFGGPAPGGVQPTGPQALSSKWQKASTTAYFGQPGSISVRTVPVELINVSADELWIIAKSEAPTAPVAPDDDGPGCGAMLAKLPKKDKKIPLPLKHTDVKG